jgi:hypothetical protein
MAEMPVLQEQKPAMAATLRAATVWRQKWLPEIFCHPCRLSPGCQQGRDFLHA